MMFLNMRICPNLHFTERDVWNAHFTYSIPICELYKNGYRSLGAKVSITKMTDVPAWEQDLKNTYERGETSGQGRINGKAAFLRLYVKRTFLSNGKYLVNMDLKQKIY